MSVGLGLGPGARWAAQQLPTAAGGARKGIFPLLCDIHLRWLLGSGRPGAQLTLHWGREQ